MKLFLIWLAATVAIYGFALPLILRLGQSSLEQVDRLRDRLPGTRSWLVRHLGAACCFFVDHRHVFGVCATASALWFEVFL
jgi:hypothetical protein